MRFEYKPLIPICRNDVNYAPQRISSKPWWNSFVTSIATGIERFILNINHSQLDIEETQYVCHHEHRFSRDNISRVKHYRVSDKKAVIIFPQGGNGYNFAQLAACYLAANGISAYELQRPIREDNLAEPFDNLDILSVKEIFAKAITEARGLVDIANEENIGVAGISLGALYSSILYGIDDRVTSACIVLGGGGIPALIKTSKAKFMQDIAARLGDIKPEEVADIEPLNYTNPDKSKNMLMINAMFDEHIPQEQGRLLWEAWGKPRQYLVRKHTSYSEGFTVLPMIVEHFNQTLA